MAGRVPVPYGAHHHHHHNQHPHLHHHHPDSQVHGAAAVQGPTLPPSGAGAKLSLQLTPVQRPTTLELVVRCKRIYSGPACEVWEKRQRRDPPPGLVKRADPTKKDSWYRIGDTMAGGTKLEKKYLNSIGFSDPGQSVFTALLFFLMDIGTDDGYQVLFLFKDIVPDPNDEWKGSVKFRRCIVAGGTILPFPHQNDGYEDLAMYLRGQEWTKGLEFVGTVLQGFSDAIMNFLWALTGEWEAKIVGEQVEKFVTHEMLNGVLKYVRGKLPKVVRVYVQAFAKEFVIQSFHLMLLAARMKAADKLSATASVAGGIGRGVITVEQIQWVQSSSQLAHATKDFGIKWELCHKKGMEEGLTEFWPLFHGKKGFVHLQKFTGAVGDAVGTFFFDLGLKKVFAQAESMAGKKIRSLVTDVLTDWAKDAMGMSPKDAKAHEWKLKDLTMSKLTDGSLVELALKYLNDHWEDLAKAALEWAKQKVVKAIAKGSGGAMPITDL
ncbi:MAG: hypothetical protein WBQ08_19965 [Candidatus Sulfotelmatobacter sp.]